jgi:hypothetical protein
MHYGLVYLSYESELQHSVLSVVILSLLAVLFWLAACFFLESWNHGEMKMDTHHSLSCVVIPSDCCCGDFLCNHVDIKRKVNTLKDVEGRH